LTRLDPGQLVYAELDDKITAPRKALQRLTSLQELILHKGDANVLLQATSKLLQLRSLNAKQLSAAGVGAFKHLPPQLQSCTFTADLSGGGSGMPADEVGGEERWRGANVTAAEAAVEGGSLERACTVPSDAVVAKCISCRPSIDTGSSSSDSGSHGSGGVKWRDTSANRPTACLQLVNKNANMQMCS
jgi:hypothetical protein